MMHARSFGLMMVLAAFPLLLGGCPSSGGGNGDDDDDGGTTPTPTPTPMTVTGHLVNYGGSPLPSESILVAGTLLTTNSAGAFTLDVTPPYSIAYYNIGSDSATVFVGVTRPDPTVTIVTGPSDRTVTVSGTISPTLGGTPTLDISSPSPPFYSQSGGSVTANAYTNRQFKWFTTPSVDATIHFTRYDVDGNSNVTNIIDYAAQAVTWTDGTTPTQNITMGAAGEGALTGTVTVPGGYVITDVSGDSSIGGNGVLRLGSTTASTFSFITLDVAGATATVSANAEPAAAGPDDGFGIAFFSGPPTSVATLTVPTMSSFTAPAALSTLSAATTITWDTPITTATGHFLSISPEDFSGTRVTIYSAVSSIEFPDLSLLVATLESEPYTMRVISYSTGITPDAALAGGSTSPFPTSGSFTATYSSALHVVGP